MGDTPHKNVDVDVFMARLKEGYRMEKPWNCPAKIYDVMCVCWNYLPGERPKWSVLVDRLKRLQIGK